MQNKIVITGANGFIGSHLADYLYSKNYEIHCIVRESSNLKWIENKGYFIHKCGLTNIDSLSNVFENAKYIFHLAGTVAALKYEDYLYGNVTLTKNILEAIKSLDVKPSKVLVTSSLAVAGPTTKNNPLKEIDGFNAIVQYGKAKVEQEKLCATYFNDFNITIARPSPITGTRETEMFEFIQSINKGIFPKVGFNEKYVNVIHITDLIEGFYQMVTSENTSGEAYFICSEKTYSWSQIASISAKLLNKKTFTLALPHSIIFVAGYLSGLFGKLIGKPQTFDYEKAKEGVQEAWLGSIEKAKKDFNFKQNTTLIEGLNEAIVWYKKEGWL